MIRTATALMRRHSHVNWVLVDQAMISGVNFLTGILLARYLGIVEFGRFTLAWMAVLFVNSIQQATIISPMMSIGPKQPEAEAPAYYGAIIVQQIIFSCAAFVLLYGGVRLSSVVFPEWGVEGLALPLATAAFAIQFQDFLRRYFFTRSRPPAAFSNDAIRYLGQIAVLAWLFLTFGDSMDSAKVMWVIAITAAAAAMCGTFLVERIEINPATLRATTFRHWHFSKWLAGSALMQWTTGNLFIIAAGGLLGPSAVGALRAAQNLMGVVHILFMGLDNIVPAQAARHFHQGGGEALYAYLKRVALFGGSATAAIAMVAAIAPNFWLGLVFGDQYVGNGYLLQWFAVIYVLMFFGLPLRAGLGAIEHTQTVFWAYLCMALFSIVAAYPFVSFLGLSGVGAGFVVHYLISIFVHVNGLKKRLVPLQMANPR